MKPEDLYKDFTEEDVRLLVGDGKEARRGSLKKYWASLSFEARTERLENSFHGKEARQKAAETRKGFWERLPKGEQIRRSRLMSEANERWWANMSPEEKQNLLNKGICSEVSVKNRSRTMRQMLEGMSGEEKKEWVGRSFHSPEGMEKSKERCGEGIRRFWRSLSDEEKLERAKNSFLKEEALLRGRKTCASPPSEPEVVLGRYLERNFPNQWAYNGDGSQGVIIGRRVPDFINIDGKKAVIEVFGFYWHRYEEEGERIDHYRGFGFDCLVLWEFECWDEVGVVNRIRSFLNE